ncbi:hypothetical protein F4680DRAFT_41453 [Xylaria scruposa]|nr:hypothetical protein F4680DRAFT_41453 [Xylaria scruposa]
MPWGILGLSLVMRWLVAFAHASWDASIHTIIHTADGFIIILNNLKVAFSNHLIDFTPPSSQRVLDGLSSWLFRSRTIKAPGALVRSYVCMGLEDAGDLTSSRAMQQHIPPQPRGLPTYPANMRKNDMPQVCIDRSVAIHGGAKGYISSMSTCLLAREQSKTRAHSYIVIVVF